MSVYKRGDVWWYKFRFEGVIRESSRSESKTVAKDAERSRRRELDQSYNQIKPRSLLPTFERAGSDWLKAEKPDLAKRTYEIYEVAYRCHLKPLLRSLLLCDIDAERIASYKEKRKAERASARTHDIGKALSREEEKRLLSACASNPLLSSVVTIALNTALRKKEIRTLRWSQIDFEKRVLTVGKTKTVGGGGRMIPMNPPVFEALAKWAGRLVESKSDDYVFPACEVAGIERKNPNMDRIDPSKPITSWRSAWRAALRGITASVPRPPSHRYHEPVRIPGGKRTDHNEHRGPPQSENA